MSIEDALLWMRMTESLCDGTEASARIVAELAQLLIADPENFPDVFWAVTNPPSLAALEALMLGGITPENTFADLQQLTLEKGRHDAI